MVGDFLFFMSKPTNTRFAANTGWQILLAVLIGHTLCLRDKRKRRIK